MFCKECGAKIDDGKFCKECKWKLEVKQLNSFTKIHGKEETQSNKRGLMKKYHPVIAVIIGYFVAGTLIHFLPNNFSSNILAIFILILGGFTATYLSRMNKAKIGLYEGLVYSINILPFIFKQQLTLNLLLTLALPPILGLVGGFIGKVLRSRLDEEKYLKKQTEYE